MSDKIGKLVGDAAKTAAEDTAGDELAGIVNGSGDKLGTVVKKVANEGVAGGIGAALKAPLGKIANIPVINKVVDAATTRVAENLANKALSRARLGNPDLVPTPSTGGATPKTNAQSGTIQSKGPQTEDGEDEEPIPDTERHEQALKNEAQNATKGKTNGSGGGGGGGGGGDPRLARMHVWTYGPYNNKEGVALIRGKSFRVTEVMNECFEVVVEGTTMDFDVSLEALVDKGMALQADYEGRPSLIWAGMCAKIEQINAPEVKQNISPLSGMNATYRLTIVPALWRTKLRVNHRIFQHQTIPDIIKEILKEWGIEEGNGADWSKVTGDYKKHEFRVQYGESDFTFISRLLEEAGISYHFRHAPVNGDISINKVTTLCFADSPEVTGELRTLPFRGNSQVLSAADDDSIISATVAQHVVHGNHMVRDHDFMKAPDYFLKQDHQAADGVDYEVYQYQPGAFWIDPGQTDEGEGQKRVTRELDSFRHNSGSLVHSRLLAELGHTKPIGNAEHVSFHDLHLHASESGGALAFGRTVVRVRTAAADVAPGQLITVGKGEGEHGMLSPGDKFLVLRRFFEGATADRRGTQTLECVPAKTPYRPPLRTPKPRIYGVQSAIVVGPKPHDEIHTDKYGRVQVRFPWDRETKKWKWDINDPIAPSCWIRVSQMWAGGQGPGFGSLVIPRVGDEVLVGFFEGDPDRPVVVGRVFNETKQVPYSLPDKKTRTVLMRTQTWSDQNVGHDGAPIMRGYNELSFEDTEEQEEFLIQAQKNHTIIVKNNETRDIGGGNETPPPNLHGGAKLPDGIRTTKILTEDMLSVGKHYKVKVGKPDKSPEGAGIEIIEEEDGTKSILLSTGTGGASILIKKDSIFLNANKEIHAHAKGKWHMSSHGEAAEIVIENANGNIKMQTANGDIRVQSDGGHKVLINCDSPDVSETEIKINGNLGHIGPHGVVVPEKTEHYDPADAPKPGKEIKWPWWPAQLPPEAPKPTPLIEAKMPGGGSEQPEGSVDDEE